MHFSIPHPLLLKHLNAAGIEWCSVLNVDEWQNRWTNNQLPEELADDLHFLKDWIAQEHYGSMGFLTKNMQARENSNHILPHTRSILSMIVPYATGEHIRRQTSTSEAQETRLPSSQKSIAEKTARYARVPDYHKAIRKELERALEHWQQDAQKMEFTDKHTAWRVVTDSLPFLDRAHARIARLGFIGKNTMLIRPGIGSYFFIAHVLLTAPFAAVADPNGAKPLAADAIAELSCGECRKCLDACPTQALIAPKHLDANKCLSYLSIEHRDIVDEEFIRHFSDRFYGCDICQEVCPYNFKTLPLTTIKPFQNTRKSLTTLSTSQVAQMTQAEYEEWFGGTAMTRAKYAGLVRNALYSLHAEHHSDLQNILALREKDPHPLIRKSVLQLQRINNG